METTKPQGATLYSVLNYIDRIVPYYFSTTNLAFPTGWLVSRNILGEPSAFKNTDDSESAHHLLPADGANEEYGVVTKGFPQKRGVKTFNMQELALIVALCMWVGGCILFFFFFFLPYKYVSTLASSALLYVTTL